MSDSLRLFIVAGEHSGDALGGKLMAALKQGSPRPIAFGGVGGEHMAEEGLDSLFPLSDVAVMGPIAIARRFPQIARRVYQTINAGVAMRPDAVVIIDSPEFTHPIAKRIRRKLPGVPVLDYVSPSVWAWRPGRAARMKAYVDHVLGLLPFEPDVHERLGGPQCSYVGHPLIERMDWIRAQDGIGLRRRLGIAAGQPVLLVLPGSRPTEVQRLMKPFGDTVDRIAAAGLPPAVVIPTLKSVRALVEQEAAGWAIKPHILLGDEDKFAAFRLATAALAASGTVTLELAVAGTPMVVAYRVEAVGAMIGHLLIKVPSIVLANLVLGENVFPEFIQGDCNAQTLSAALIPLLSDTPERARQLAALGRIDQRLRLPQGSPSDAAAAIVLRYADRAGGKQGV